MNTNELVSDIKTGDNVKANKSFNSVMGEKLKAVLDAEKVGIASGLGQTSDVSDEIEEVEVEVPEEE
jgi:hypothetical protein